MINHTGDVLLDSYVFVNPRNVVDYLSSGEFYPQRCSPEITATNLACS